MRELVLLLGKRGTGHEKPWRLVIRTHDLGGTDYQTIAWVSDDEAKDLTYTGDVHYLYSSALDDRAADLKLDRIKYHENAAAKLRAK